MSDLAFFLDTASVTELKKFLDWGVIDGLTTNQKLFAMEGNCSFEDRVRELCALVDGPVSVETTGHTYEELVEEGR
ncbi:MAG: fructose-6-phosphate aldolase, partial [Candidatus Omnitrophica bacterium]|nr:fructose-6-phosphate aldolase [Candidatus Omnitrophota bacterium]